MMSVWSFKWPFLCFCVKYIKFFKYFVSLGRMISTNLTIDRVGQVQDRSVVIVRECDSSHSFPWRFHRDWERDVRHLSSKCRFRECPFELRSQLDDRLPRYSLDPNVDPHDEKHAKEYSTNYDIYRIRENVEPTPLEITSLLTSHIHDDDLEAFRLLSHSSILT